MRTIEQDKFVLGLKAHLLRVLRSKEATWAMRDEAARELRKFCADDDRWLLALLLGVTP